MAILPFRPPVPPPGLRYFLLFPALCLAAVAVGCSSLPAPHSAASPVLPRLASSGAPAADQHELRLRLEAGSYVRTAVTPASVDLVLRRQEADGSTAEELQIPGGGDEPRHLSWITSAAGETRWILVAREPGALPECCAIAAEEIRAAGPCDEVRLRIERAVLAAQWQLSRPGNDAAAGADVRDLVEPILAAATEMGDGEATLPVLVELARAARLAGSNDAAALIDRAVEASHAMGHSRAEAKALEERAQRLPADQAVPALLAALELWQRVGSENGEAEVLYQAGTFYYYMLRDPERALQSYRRALELQVRNEDLRGQSWTLSELGVFHGIKGDLDRSHEYLNLAFERGRDAGDFRAQAAALEGSARFDIDLGDLQAAYDEYSQARKLLQEDGVSIQAAFALNGLARVLLYLGKPEQARKVYGEALTDFVALNDAEGRADTLLGIGSTFEQQGDPASALRSFQTALKFIRTSGLPRLEGLALYDLGKVHRELRLPIQAIEELEAAFALEANDSPVRQAQAQFELANAYIQAGKTTEAERAFRYAIRLSDRSPIIEAAAQAGLARIERDRGELAAARSAIGRALEITERLRSGVLRPDQRVSFLASRRAYYEFLVDLLMRFDRIQPNAGHDVEAVEASEEARARGLLDLLARDHVEVRRGIPAELKKREDEIGLRIARLQTRLLSSASQALPEVEVQRLDHDLAQAEEEEQDLGAEILRRQPAYAAMVAPRRLPLSEIQRRLDDRTALFEFFLGEESSYLFAVTSRGMAAYALPSKSEIARLVDRVNFAVHEDSRLHSGQFADDAYELYRMLFTPAARELTAKDHLIIAPDGQLYSLSFEVLLTDAVHHARYPRRDLPYLIRERSISYVPSASVMAQLLTERRPAEVRNGGLRFVGFGDPEVGSRLDGAAELNPRPRNTCEIASGEDGKRPGPRQVESAIATARPLPGARDEVCRIAKLFAPGEAVVFTGPAATEDTVKTNALVAAATNLHFASHGLLDEGHPELSGLRLTHAPGSMEDGLLQVREIFNLELRADLVVLSACRTGLGKVVSGEGLIGMTRAFLYAGAGSVVVSLWQVDDDSTSDLMVSFYRHLQEVGDKSEALRRAKLELIDRSQYFHPYFWAPFILVGRAQ